MQWHPIRRLKRDISLGRYEELAQFTIPIVGGLGAYVKRGGPD
jgi:hypothetical protein